MIISSSSRTSRPAALIIFFSRAMSRASVSMTAPRETLSNTAPFLISRMFWRLMR